MGPQPTPAAQHKSCLPPLWGNSLISLGAVPLPFEAQPLINSCRNLVSFPWTWVRSALPHLRTGGSSAPWQLPKTPGGSCCSQLGSGPLGSTKRRPLRSPISFSHCSEAVFGAQVKKPKAVSHQLSPRSLQAANATGPWRDSKGRDAPGSVVREKRKPSMCGRGPPICPGSPDRSLPRELLSSCAHRTPRVPSTV